MSAKFVFEWSFPWNIFETLSEQSPDYYSDTFITSRNGVAYKWKGSVTVSLSEDESWFGLYLQFSGGCSDTVDAVACAFEILNGGTPVTKMSLEPSAYNENGDNCMGFEKFDRFSKEILQNKYKLQPLQPFTLRFTLDIPQKAFEYCAKFPLVDAPEWLSQQYENIDKPPSMQDGIFSDIQVVSNDGVSFYVQKHILQCQLKPLRAIIHRGGIENDMSIQFPTFDSVALRGLLRFLYVGLVDTAGLPTDVIIRLLDAAEQYEMPILKEACNAALWKRVNDKCKDAPVIIKAADTYKLNGLKMYAMSVLVENFSEIQGAVDVFNTLTKELHKDMTIYLVSRTRCHMIS